MHVSYIRLVEVRILHDYYLDSIDSVTGNTKWPKDYNIKYDMEIIPSPECEILMRNYKMIFKSTPNGFTVFVLIDPENPTQSLIYIDPSVKLTFLLRLRNSYFMNFTNIPLIRKDRNLFCFQNLTSNKLGTTLFLSAPILPFSAASQYQYGDLVIHNNKVLEVIKSSPVNPTPVATRVDCSKPVVPPATAFWCESSVTDARYVTAADILLLQGNIFEYNSVNTAPGAVITFTLTDINGQPVLLDNIPNTGKLQTEYIAPVTATQPCSHRIDMSGIPAGKYTLAIQKGGVAETRVFYYIDPLRFSNVFAVVELLTGVIVPADYQFLKYIPAPDGPVSAIQAKDFEIRFKNRITKREYIKKDNTILPEKPVAGLTRKYSGFKILSDAMPDPNPALIHPKRVSNDPANADYNKLEAVNSEIYLNQ